MYWRMIVNSIISLYKRRDISIDSFLLFMEGLCINQRPRHGTLCAVLARVCVSLCFMAHELMPVLDPKFSLSSCLLFSMTIGKGCVGGIIWSFWYDELDIFLDETNSFSFFNIFGIVTDQWTKSYLGIVKTTLSILIEQFLWCPIVFGTFEIPVSTILNGGGLSSVKKEVDSKLGDLLISNAKIWTFANILIYGPVPVAWRPVISNCVDIIWQSIVSSVSADCGKVEDDICTVVGDDTFENIVTMSNDFATPDASVADDTSAMNDAEKDLAFYAEKSRF